MSDNKTIKSWKNLESAFAGESMAFQRYRYFAKIARKDGNEEVAKLFEDTAKHESAHAEAHLRSLYPFDKMSVEDALKEAVAGEKYEYSEMYPQFEREAKEEAAADWFVKEFNDAIKECREHADEFQKRLNKVSKVFNGLTKVEKEHHDNYAAALSNERSGEFSESDQFLKEYQE